MMITKDLLQQFIKTPRATQEMETIIIAIGFKMFKYLIQKFNNIVLETEEWNIV